MTDDAIREVHGCSCRRGDNATASTVTIRERSETILLEGNILGSSLTPWQARYLAAKLYRLSRRVLQRNEVITLATTDGRKG